MDDVGYRTAAAVFLLFSCDFASADLPYHQFEYATESHLQCLPKADRKSLEAVTGLGRVGCNSGGNTMNGFALDQRAVELCPNSDYLTFNALCTNPTQRAPYSCYTKYTPACLQYSTAGLQALVDHPLQCSDYEAIENWQWFQCSEGNLYVRYQCCHITWLSPTITPYSTGCRNMNAGTMDEFKQHPVACPGADHLQSWKLVACMTRPNFYRIDYTCLAAEPT
ncbi:hypothetical protein DIPPA_14668 [Diplonema papillatum]|nr:hypothetical protein DIPPA_14668 [Diplonema papillatum]